MNFTGINLSKLPRKLLPIFFLVDASEKMSGDKIDSMNKIMPELLSTIKEISDNNCDVEIKISIMKICSEIGLITQYPVDIEKFEWKGLETSGKFDLGKACLMLNEKLDKNEFLKNQYGLMKPIIFLFSDGNVLDDLSPNFEVLKNNKWFIHSNKLAFHLTDEFNEDVLADFTGSNKLVLKCDDLLFMNRLVQFVFKTYKINRVVSFSQQISEFMENLNFTGKDEKQI